MKLEEQEIARVDFFRKHDGHAVEVHWCFAGEEFTITSFECADCDDAIATPSDSSLRDT
jgi:hypothetical protein